MKRITLMFIIFFLSIVSKGQTSLKYLPLLNDSYLGQKPPEENPEILMPGLISTGFDEKLIAVHPSGKEIYFTIMLNGFSTILVTKMQNGAWTSPEIADFSGFYFDTEPSFHPDGSRMFFTSKRPVSNYLSELPDNTLHKWYMDRVGDKWTEPKPMEAPVNGKWKTCGSSVAMNGNIYFAMQSPEKKGIYLYRSKYINGKYQKLEFLPECINLTIAQDYPCISPDESYLIFNAFGRNDVIGGKGQNLYVSFRDENDNWTTAINLGNKINNNRLGEGSYISADGKYFFFSCRSHTDMNLPLKSKPTYEDLKRMLISEPNNSTLDIYWVSTKFIEELKPKDL